MACVFGVLDWASRYRQLSCDFGPPLSVDPTPALVAALITWFGFSPPKSILRLISNGVARQLFFVVWHFGVFLPAIILLTMWEGDERKCFVHALLACYFVALPLESGRRIRSAR